MDSSHDDHEIPHHIQTIRERTQYRQKSDEWYAVRKTLLTASEVASVLDIKPYASYRGSPRTELMRNKLAKHFGTSDDHKSGSNPFCDHGNKYEDEARDIYEETTGEKVYEFGLMIHADIPWLGASPDGICASRKLLEIKCPVKREVVPGYVPEHYIPQLHINMQVFDLLSADFVEYVPQHMTWPKPRVFEITNIPRDDTWWEDTLPKLQSFWDELQHSICQPQTLPKMVSPKKTSVQRQTSTVIITDDLYD